ncbi:hypothetical protein [Pseudomonas sp. MWU12-2037]|uniref:DUF6124 family protein n=1 Tax=Pseudomonas sp. MWU12-2037 TaxID=2928690 RepID=UPI0020109EFC|nr:hypothetical protein [Pseudomonas sp. MWU12-2037]
MSRVEVHGLTKDTEGLMSGSNRKVAMGVVHLIEMAQLWMDSVLDRHLTNVNG